MAASTTMTLDGQGNPNSVFIFQFGAAFSTGASSIIKLVNDAQASNVFWVVTGAVSIGANGVVLRDHHGGGRDHVRCGRFS